MRQIRIWPTVIFVLACALSAIVVPIAAEAQQAAKIPRIGYLSPRPGPSFYDEAFLKGLSDLGHTQAKISPLNTDGRIGHPTGSSSRLANWSA
jgi:hypothetical protein